MSHIEAWIAPSLWWDERKSKGAHNYIVKSIPLLFQTLDALYIETRKLPLHSLSGRGNRNVDTSYTFVYEIFLNPVEYTALRSILSLSGDIYEMLEPLKELNTSELLELDNPIRELYNHATRFRQFRNFFTHLGEAITDMDEHGISGPLQCDSTTHILLTQNIVFI